MIWSWRIPPDWPDSSDSRADRVLFKSLEEGLGEWAGGKSAASRSRLQKLIEEGRVTADGSAIRANSKLRPGSLLRIEFPEPKPLQAKAEDRPLDILYQDKHLVVVNKPPGLTVHPSETQADGTLVNILLHHVRDLSGIGGTLRPGIVHRIDKNTSGALVVTKTDEAHGGLVRTFARHEIERAYWALCYGAPAATGAKPVRISGRIGRSPSDRKKMALLKSGGRDSTSHYRVLEKYGERRRERPGAPEKAPFASWLEVTLETGRTHQVRVHLTSIGHSILGDPAYGAPTERQPKWLALPRDVRQAALDLPGQALHARVLGFAHPITGERLRFEAEPPAAFADLLRVLQRYGMDTSPA